MKINPNIFRAYDIRGTYPDEINENVAYLIGRAFVYFLKKKKPTIVVGQDNRISSPILFQGLTRGLLDGGAKIFDIGLVTTPMLYFACAHYKYDGGIQISASHNPPQYNGFKLVRERAIPISSKSGLREILRLTNKTDQRVKKGSIIKKNVLEDYLNFNFRNFKKEFRSLKIVIDTANAAGGILIPHLKKRLRIYSLFEKLDGSFPNHSPDPLKKENLKFLQKEIKKRKADFGVAFDGDGDRICFVDEKGQIISGDLIFALLAEVILKENPGKKILYDIRSSNIVPETIKKEGGIPIVSRIGHSFIKEKMRTKEVFFAGELSGHYYHQDHYFCETPLFVLFKIIETISERRKPLSKLIQPYRKYFQSGEINFKVKDKKKILENLEKVFAGKGKITKIDGLRVDFPDWWFLARPSGTEDLLRLSLEAKTKKLLKKKKKELTFLISKMNII